MDEIREGTENIQQTVTEPQYYAEQQTPIAAEAVERGYSPLQTVFAWLSLLAGYLMCRVFPVTANPLGGFILLLLLYTAAAVILIKQGAKASVSAVLAAVFGVLVAATLLLSSNTLLQQISYLFSLATLGYFVYCMTGNRIQKGLSNYILLDYFKALVILPFCSFGHLFRAMFYGKASSGGRAFAKVILGVAIALVPTLVVVSLLSYDQGFSDILNSIFDFGFLDIMSHMLSIGFGIPIGMYIFGLFLSSFDGDKAKVINAETVQKVSVSLKKMPAITALAASMPLIFLYIVFFISQWKYYVSGFKGVLPDDESYANYAREGFFQLCTVSVINLVAIIVLSLFLRRNETGKSALLKLLSIVFSAFTLVLISTAIAKMIMYIDCYGLTPKRVYASWFMILLALIFMLIIINQFVARLRLIITSFGLCVALFAALSLSNVDGIIAKYNVDRYLDGSLTTVDVKALYDLGDAAVPEMVRLAEELDEKLGTDIKSEVKSYDYTIYEDADRRVYSVLVIRLRDKLVELDCSDDGVFSYNVQRWRAENALNRIKSAE